MLKPGLAETAEIPPAMRLGPQRAQALDAVAGRHDATRAQVALAWLLGRSQVTLAIPGTASLAHLEENVAAADLRLTPDEIDELDRLAA